ncbi:hypothetical protein GLOIN_2v1476691 [Rhizophagus irregularis DAOM 181602=DAOM 197198]|uniref:Uncharacterized protein n=1 Tax=Rhizophagus irregularis (strain DAOM 181602 / DAOM 197198 / MUCL 43194) TaxID=747089 RepID=A0A2P4Q7X1_RHIID|nr:hypothetical protein GLOIN_2v1476691 [Rhizophagus irregularis DAOM 181602=DAOM 197198]POG73751.1 hypothetical protein GLOIN_2v1476691 [Rhizophagus irregularis DAOM 181602=DAOM 197198]|eukprot:XP_025180617.1 hypothetical protein GLOIN_2v1476691 [Rhizophagus irregularis DAOM 181602=DAOM 197198]
MADHNSKFCITSLNRLTIPFFMGRSIFNSYSTLSCSARKNIQIHSDSNTLINRNRKEVARLEAIKAINDVEDIKIFDDDFFSDEPIDSNHPINARTERVPEGPRISVQVTRSQTN